KSPRATRYPTTWRSFIFRRFNTSLAASSSLIFFQVVFYGFDLLRGLAFQFLPGLLFDFPLPFYPFSVAVGSVEYFYVAVADWQMALEEHPHVFVGFIYHRGNG